MLWALYEGLSSLFALVFPGYTAEFLGFEPGMNTGLIRLFGEWNFFKQPLHFLRSRVLPP